MSDVEEVIERQRHIWEGHDEARQVIDCFEVELGLLTSTPAKVTPEPPVNSWLDKLRHRMKNRTPFAPKFRGDSESMADRGPNRRRDLHDIMQHATLAQVDQMVVDQRKFVNDLHYKHRDAEELLHDISAVRRGMGDFS